MGGRLGCVVWAAVVFVAGLGAVGQTPGHTQCRQKIGPPSDAEAALAREEYATALDLYKKMAGAAADESKSGVIRTLLAEDKTKDADDLAQAWVKDSPESAVATETLGEVFYREGDLGDAAEINQAAHTLDACNARSYLLTARLDGLSANFKTAKAHILMAHRLAPQDVEIREAWIDTLDRGPRLAQWGVLLSENRYLNPRDRDRLSRNLAKTSAAPSPEECSLSTPVASTTIPIEAVSSGPNTEWNMGLDVAINGIHKKLEIDTGASGIVLSRYAALSMGLKRDDGKDLSSGVGNDGDVNTSVVHGTKVKIGNVEFHNCRVEILDKFSAMGDNGLIGGDVFSKFLVTMDFPKQRIHLDPLPPLPGTSAPQSTAAAGGAVAGTTADIDEPVHDRYIAPEMKDWTKIFRVGSDLLIPVRLGGVKWRLFLVDTGSDLMMITPDAARDVTKVTSDVDAQVYGISGKVAKVYQTGRFLIEFADLSTHGDLMTAIDTTKISHNDGVEVSGFVGEPVLYLFAMHIDYRDNLMKFDYDTKPHW